MSFPSILFADRADLIAANDAKRPAYYSDLGLDQVLSAILSGKENHRLESFFFHPLTAVSAIEFRQNALRDIERGGLQAVVGTFAQAMAQLRARQASSAKRRNPIQANCWLLETVWKYCRCVEALDRGLRNEDLQSTAFQSTAKHLEDYLLSEQYEKLAKSSDALRAALTQLRYKIIIDGLVVTVDADDGHDDLGAVIATAFEHFTPERPKRYPFDHDDAVDVHAVQEKILERVAAQHQELFDKIRTFAGEHGSFMDPAIIALDREVHFYLSFLSFIAPLRNTGLPFCIPHVQDGKSEHVSEGFDLALAAKLQRSRTDLVPNDFDLSGSERIIIVSGPNQGGKTTFARMFGQLHYFAALGLPVPAREARLFVADQLFTHFERQERIDTLRGKLQDDLVRAKDILQNATPRSVIIVNELFASTTFDDALELSRRVATTIARLDALCVWVTFIPEIAGVSPSTVSMVGTVAPDNPEMRTFKIIRSAPDSVAHARTIAQKYRLDPASICERVPA